MTITLSGSAITTGPHQVQITAGTTTASVRWAGSGDWTETIALDTEATTETIALLPAASADQLLLDQVQWSRPVALTVDERGTTFQGEAGIWRYQLGELGDGQALYDVTDPVQPVKIALHGGSFTAGPEAHRYLVTGSATLHTPEVQQLMPLDLVTPRQADVVYVAPAAFLAILIACLQNCKQMLRTFCMCTRDSKNDDAIGSRILPQSCKILL